MYHIGDFPIPYPLRTINKIYEFPESFITIPIKKVLLYGDRCLTGTCCFWNYSPIYIDFVRGTPFQKAKIIHKRSVTVYYQKRLSDLDTLIKITITKILSFQHQKYSLNIKLLKLI